MEINIAKSAGFCFGVKNAVELALKTAKAEKNVYTFGEIIHNKGVVSSLAAEGIRVCESVENLKEGDTVIIRSHGISEEIFLKLGQVGCKIIDATCPFVSKIHNIVREYHEKGYQIIIIGEPKHPEVLGINGWCENSAIVLCDNEKLTLCDNKKYCVVSQTTFSLELYQKIADSIKNLVKTVEFFNTICYTTKERQIEAEVLAKKCDVMLVLGGKHSSNTTKLFDLCRKFCNNTFLIENISDLSSIVANKIDRLGITAGASTPQGLIEEVVKTMGESQEKSVGTLNEESASVSKAKQEVKNTTMDDLKDMLEDSFKTVQIAQGRIYDVIVISATDKGISVSFNGKKDGFIDKTEVEISDSDYNPESYKRDDIISAMAIEGGKDKTFIAFSKKRIDIKEKEKKECEEVLKGGEFSVTIERAVKGGLMSKLGPYTIFVPASQIRIGYVNDLEKYVGKKMRLAVLPPKANDDEVPQEVSINSKRIVASQRIILEREKYDREDAFWSSMQVGDVVLGKVKRFSEFGAFVMVNGFDCLAHISDLSWYKIEDPSEVLELNKTYEFVIIRTDRENNRVSLGYKQLQRKPYELAVEKFPVGTVLKCKVERVFPYGAFVSIDKGVDGLIPVSEISHSWIKNAAEAYKPGDEVEAQIINFEGSKITLSAKVLLPMPEIVEIEQNIEETAELEREVAGEGKAKKKRVIPTAGERQPRARTAGKKADSDEIKEWTTESAGATLGDLLKDLDFNFEKD